MIIRLSFLTYDYLRALIVKLLNPRGLLIDSFKDNKAR